MSQSSRAGPAHLPRPQQSWAIRHPWEWGQWPQHMGVAGGTSRRRTLGVLTTKAEASGRAVWQEGPWAAWPGATNPSLGPGVLDHDSELSLSMLPTQGPCLHPGWSQLSRATGGHLEMLTGGGKSWGGGLTCLPRVRTVGARPAQGPEPGRSQCPKRDAIVGYPQRPPRGSQQQRPPREESWRGPARGKQAPSHSRESHTSAPSWAGMLLPPDLRLTKEGLARG